MTATLRFAAGVLSVAAWMIVSGASSGVMSGAQSRSCVALSPNDAEAMSRVDRLDYSWAPPVPDSVNSLGSIRFRPLRSASKGYQLEITVVPISDSLRFQSASCSNRASGGSAALTFQAGSRQVELLVDVVAGHSGVLALDLSASQVSVASVAVAGWPAVLEPQAVAIPYYSSPVTWLPTLGVFSNIYWDWMTSNATQLTNSSAVYQPLTSGLRNSLHDRLVIKMSPNLDDVLPDIPNPKSAYMSSVAGRTVLDIWGGAFSSIATTLATLRNAGLKDCVVLIHVWQHSGYDNGLPGHYPANSAQGGDSGLASAVQAGKAAGCFVGVHENYVDYYPDYAQFDSNAIALDSKGQKQNAWYNPGTAIQSFGTRPSLLVSNAAPQSHEIHRRYQTMASFIDVNSSTFPWWRSDMDAATRGAGMFSTYRNASTDLWAFERTVHEGPVFGEGNRHWFWSGLLDGVEAQFGAVNIKASNPEAPLFVDFDLLKIHPLQVNHGMGYYGRWLPAGHAIQQTMLLDAYRMQEIAYGHAPFVGSELWDNVSQVVIEQNLVGSVAKRYGTETAKTIQYEINGVWTDTNAAVAAGDWSRVQVQYSNGDLVVANARPQTLNWQGLTLPQNGWAAKGDGLLAYTAIKARQIVDYSETPTSYFANARNQNDLQHAGVLAQPSVNLFQQLGDRKATFQIKWDVLDQPGPENLNNFIHFVDSAGAIAFAADHFPFARTSNWIPGQTILDRFRVDIPSSVVDGTYSMKIGLYSTITGVRVRLLGQNDGTTRYIMGNLVIAGGGKTLIFQPVASPSVEPDPRLNSAGSVVDFGTIQTDGIVSLLRDGSGWILRAYPSSRNVAVRLNSAVFPPPKSVICDAGPTRAQTPSVVNGYWSVQAMGANYCKWLLK